MGKRRMASESRFLFWVPSSNGAKRSLWMGDQRSRVGGDPAPARPNRNFSGQRGVNMPTPRVGNIPW
jgi:hypothetical protein